MQHINMLLIKARKSALSNYSYAIGFVDYDEETQKYIAKPQPWDGNTGHGTSCDNMPDWWRDEWSTEDEATEALYRLFNGLGIPENNCVVFLMDYGLED